MTMLYLQRIHGLKCCSIRNNNATLYTKTPPLLKIAVSGVTELLRLLSPPQPKRGNQNQKDEIPVSSIDDVLMIIQSDYMNAYFVTGNFTCSIYAEDCIFEDPTISFRGRELYARNLKLLVPFFDSASITLQNIDKAVASDTNLVVATWKLRTNLKLPWRPLISIDGSTRYELDKEFKIVKHVESWNVSALEAIAQIFTFNFGKSAG
ncbi:nuclear transport factor NTF2-like domain-containing protein [Senna tora]|uniref:Nuclear transport factor NTF2-like domain-containing protein n=1 Tax=Senna tora TaxID=362788 RepID=A0A834W149_9FABA|nr:nuclear transport factor NTF2-like domain-containing protein [Senna tora]